MLILLLKSLIVSNVSCKFGDMDLPIALHKATQSCTLHLISKFMSYNVLSPSFVFFTTKLDNTMILKEIQEALHITE